MLNQAILLALVCGVIALAYGGFTAMWILKQPDGNDRMREIAAAVQTGAKAYLNRQYTTIGAVGAVHETEFGEQASDRIAMPGWSSGGARLVSLSGKIARNGARAPSVTVMVVSASSSFGFASTRSSLLKFGRASLHSDFRAGESGYG